VIDIGFDFVTLPKRYALQLDKLHKSVRM